MNKLICSAPFLFIYPYYFYFLERAICSPKGDVVRKLIIRFIFTNKINTCQVKFIAPSILLIPLKCKPNIAKSTLGPLCDCIPDKGGYRVQPVIFKWTFVVINPDYIEQKNCSMYLNWVNFIG